MTLSCPEGCGYITPISKVEYFFSMDGNPPNFEESAKINRINPQIADSLILFCGLQIQGFHQQKKDSEKKLNNTFFSASFLTLNIGIFSKIQVFRRLCHSTNYLTVANTGILNPLGHFTLKYNKTLNQQIQKPLMALHNIYLKLFIVIQIYNANYKYILIVMNHELFCLTNYLWQVTNLLI